MGGVRSEGTPRPLAVTFLSFCRYVDYLLDALRRRELFTWLQLSPRQFWHTLLLRDRHNYFGIRAHLPEALGEQLRNAPGALTQVGGPPLLPPPLFWRIPPSPFLFLPVCLLCSSRCRPPRGLFCLPCKLC